MASTRFMMGSAACQQLRETHLKNVGLELPPFKSYEERGAKDYPSRIVLYESIMPMHTAPPIAVFTLQRDLTYKAHADPQRFAHKDVHSWRPPNANQS